MTAASLNPNPGKIDWVAELKAHADWLRTVIATRSGESQAVDEIFQEVATAAIQQKAPISDANKIAPWLYQVAVRQSLMHRRKHGRRRKLERNYAQTKTDQQSIPRDPLGWLLHNERRQVVRKAMQELNPRDAEILMLKYTQDWSYREIADHLGVSESAVEARLHRARKRLRSQLTSYVNQTDRIQ